MLTAPIMSDQVWEEAGFRVIEDIREEILDQYVEARLFLPLPSGRKWQKLVPNEVLYFIREQLLPAWLAEP